MFTVLKEMQDAEEWVPSTLQVTTPLTILILNTPLSYRIAVEG